MLKHSSKKNEIATTVAALVRLLTEYPTQALLLLYRPLLVPKKPRYRTTDTNSPNLQHNIPAGIICTRIHVVLSSGAFCTVFTVPIKVLHFRTSHLGSSGQGSVNES